ncbi:hypothetical protein BJ322DRAFT_989704, partial [Thelephora terrestris]
IQRVLKLAIRRSALQDIINNTMEQLAQGTEPSMVTFEKGLPLVRNRSVKWLVNGYKAIDNPDLVQKAFQLCSTGQGNFNLSFESLTSREARRLLFERISTDPEFYKSL